MRAVLNLDDRVAGADRDVRSRQRLKALRRRQRTEARNVAGERSHLGQVRQRSTHMPPRDADLPSAQGQVVNRAEQRGSQVTDQREAGLVGAASPPGSRCSTEVRTCRTNRPTTTGSVTAAITVTFPRNHDAVRSMPVVWSNDAYDARATCAADSMNARPSPPSR